MAISFEFLNESVLKWDDACYMLNDLSKPSRHVCPDSAFPFRTALYKAKPVSGEDMEMRGLKQEGCISRKLRESEDLSSVNHAFRTSVRWRV